MLFKKHPCCALCHSVLWLMDIVAVWLMDIVFFSAGILVYTVRQSYAFCNLYSLFTLLFLSKQTRHERNILSYIYFMFVSGYTNCLLREQCVGT